MTQFARVIRLDESDLNVFETPARLANGRFPARSSSLTGPRRN